MHTVAIIDIGTVSVRLLLAQCNQLHVEPLYREAQITNLGQGRSSEASLDPEAIERTVSCVKKYVGIAKERGIQTCATILTSAARDAENIQDLLDPLECLGLKPQVVPGEIEARLSFLGVATDYLGERIMVVDIGGGSTEVVLGQLCQTQTEDGHSTFDFELDSVRSYDVGCRRVSELFEKHDPPLTGDLANAREWILDQLRPGFSELDPVDQLICVGGTPTSLVAVEKELEPYDVEQVHHASLNGAQLENLIDKFVSLNLYNRAQLPGLQEKRAPVIVSGSLILESVMALGGFTHFVVSENDLLYGLAQLLELELEKVPHELGWRVEYSETLEDIA